MREITSKKMFIANIEAISCVLFKRNIYSYIAIFCISIFYLNFSEAEQYVLTEKYFYPIFITAVYILISEIVNYSPEKIRNLSGELQKQIKQDYLNRNEMTQQRLNQSALHEASHFIAYLKEDFESFLEIDARINTVNIKSNIKDQRTSLESIYNCAFIKYIPFVVEKKYYTSSWELFTNSTDFKDFELLIRTYLINSKKIDFFINPINESEASHNAKLINNLKEQIELECEQFIIEYEDFLIEVKNILIERDIKTVEAKELLLKGKQKSIKNN